MALVLAACSSAQPEEPSSTAGVTINVEQQSLDEQFSVQATSGESEVQWFSERIVGNSHVGFVPLQSGSLVRDESGFSGNFVIDMTGMTADGDRVLQHLKSDDFFDVENYPTSTLVITSAQKQEANEYLVTGDLTIMNSTNEISFPATIVRSEQNIVLSSEFEIDRTRWGVVYDSGSVFDGLGDRAISDMIQYDVRIVFNDA